ncbi:hypothetical protein OH76DRAFT_1183605 [Lentinus brumalis]|uniref:Uncharacterized protein n=1 Tax=Lentinus brumalis TaxID=2498619 RepID=A0A371CU04_9APHY|nr:hypothetical protein OH76DRAFT_1183605 [Polyporus brumalis]
MPLTRAEVGEAFAACSVQMQSAQCARRACIVGRTTLVSLVPGCILEYSFGHAHTHPLHRDGTQVRRPPVHYILTTCSTSRRSGEMAVGIQCARPRHRRTPGRAAHTDSTPRGVEDYVAAIPIAAGICSHQRSRRHARRSKFRTPSRRVCSDWRRIRSWRSVAGRPIRACAYDPRRSASHLATYFPH